MFKSALEAVSHPDFLIVKIDPQFNFRYARVIHRVNDFSHPSGRTTAYSGTAAEIEAALAEIKRANQYDLA